MKNLIFTVADFLLGPWISMGIVIIIGLIYTTYSIYNKKESLIQYIPQVWISLGVLGTFIALFYNLAIKDIPIKLEYSKILKRDIETIDIIPFIKSLTSAFSTSIAGIIGSVFSSFFLKGKYETKKIKIKQPWDQKDEKELLYEIAQSIQMLENNNSNVLNKVDSNISAIKDNIAGNIADLIQTFEKRLEKHLENIGSEAFNEVKILTKKINQDFQKNLTELIEKQEKQLNKSIKQTGITLEEINDNMRQNITDAMNNFAQAVEKFQNSTDQLNIAFNGYIQTTKNGFDEVNNKYNETATTINRNIASTMNNFTGQLENVTINYKKTLETLNNKIVTDTAKVFFNNLSTLENSFKKLEEYQISSQQILSQTVEEFRSTVENYNLIQNNENEIINLIHSHINETNKLFSTKKEILESLSHISKLLPDLTSYMETVNHLLENIQVYKVNGNNHFKIVSVNGTTKN